MEIELKLLLPAGAGRLRHHPLLAQAVRQRRLLRTLYFDTPDWRLARDGIALRVRREERGWVQTLKTEGQSGGGFSARQEENVAVAGPWPELARLRLPEARLCDKLAGELAVRFETRFWRDTWLVAAEGGQIEIALDKGAIRAQGREEAICELELELKDGDPAALFEAALALADAAPLWPFEASKASRGVALARGAAPAPATAVDCALTPDMRAAQALDMICRNAFGQLLANLPGTLEGRDDEYLHQARVALRRLRAALKLGRDLRSPPKAAMQGLAELGQLLGEVRDWDVQGGAVLPPLLEAWPHPGAAASLRIGVENLRQESHALLARHLISPGVTRLLLMFARWLTVPDARRRDTELVPWVHRRLERYRRDVAGCLGAMAGGRDDEIHALRLAVKRLRYALEFFQGVLGKDARAFAHRLGRLQDDLGHYNDLCVAVQRLGQAAARAGVANTDFATGWLAAQKEGLRTALRKDCVGLDKAPPRW